MTKRTHAAPALLIALTILIPMTIPACSSGEPGSPGVTTTIVDIELSGVSTNATAARVSPSFFEGTYPMLGRHFTDSDAAESVSRVVMLGHGLWESKLDGSPEVIGSLLTVQGQPLTVVGVHAPDFEPAVEVWLLAGESTAAQVPGDE